VVLIVKSVVVSAGLLRIFGREVAELPLVATSREHQGKKKNRKKERKKERKMKNILHADLLLCMHAATNCHLCIVILIC